MSRDVRPMGDTKEVARSQFRPQCHREKIVAPDARSMPGGKRIFSIIGQKLCVVERMNNSSTVTVVPPHVVMFRDLSCTMGAPRRGREVLANERRRAC